MTCSTNLQVLKCVLPTLIVTNGWRVTMWQSKTMNMDQWCNVQMYVYVCISKYVGQKEIQTSVKSIDITLRHVTINKVVASPEQIVWCTNTNSFHISDLKKPTVSQATLSSSPWGCWSNNRYTNPTPNPSWLQNVEATRMAFFASNGHLLGRRFGLMNQHHPSHDSWPQISPKKLVHRLALFVCDCCPKSNVWNWYFTRIFSKVLSSLNRLSSLRSPTLTEIVWDSYIYV